MNPVETKRELLKKADKIEGKRNLLKHADVIKTKRELLKRADRAGETKMSLDEFKDKVKSPEDISKVKAEEAATKAESKAAPAIEGAAKTESKIAPALEKGKQLLAKILSGAGSAAKAVAEHPIPASAGAVGIAGAGMLLKNLLSKPAVAAAEAIAPEIKTVGPGVAEQVLRTIKAHPVAVGAGAVGGAGLAGLLGHKHDK